MYSLFLITFLITLVVMPFARMAALRFDFTDTPGGRKKHDNPVPPIGGVVLFPVFLGGAAWVLAQAGSLDIRLGAYFAAILLLLVVGAWDDKSQVRPRIKFGAQILAAILIVLVGKAQLFYMGNLLGFGTLWLGFMGIPFSIVACVLLINAMNLMDGLDGLAGGVGFISLSSLCFIAAVGGSSQALLLILLLGALASFLMFNARRPLRPRATVFLGDAGSLALGLSLAWFSITLAQDRSLEITPISVAWFLALPIFDTCGQFARRVSQGRHPFDADHHHFHHHFIYAGLRAGQATAAILAIHLLLCLVGFLPIYGIPEYIMSYIWIGLLLGHIFMSMRPHRYRRIIVKLFAKSKGQENSDVKAP